MKTTIAQTIEGNLTDNHTYFPPADRKRAMLQLTIASQNRRQENGQWVDGPADFIQVKIFGRSAEILETLWNNGQLGKGMSVIAIGRFDPRPSAWIGKDGKAHAQVSFNAENLTTNIALLAMRQNRDTTPVAAPEQPASSEDDWMTGYDPGDMPF